MELSLELRVELRVELRRGGGGGRGWWRRGGGCGGDDCIYDDKEGERRGQGKGESACEARLWRGMVGGEVAEEEGEVEEGGDGKDKARRKEEGGRVDKERQSVGRKVQKVRLPCCSRGRSNRRSRSVEERRKRRSRRCLSLHGFPQSNVRIVRIIAFSAPISTLFSAPI